MPFSRGFNKWCEDTAIEQRRELNLKPADPLNPWRLAAHLGVEVRTLRQVPGLDPDSLRILVEVNPEGWSTVSISAKSRDLIVLNSLHPRARLASDLAHELSHVLLRHDPTSIDVAEEGSLTLRAYDDQQEAEATRLAGCLLLPREALISIQKRRLDLRFAVRKYGVSLDLMQYRLSVTGVNEQLSRGGKRALQAPNPQTKDQSPSTVLRRKNEAPRTLRTKPQEQ